MCVFGRALHNELSRIFFQITRGRSHIRECFNFLVSNRRFLYDMAVLRILRFSTFRFVFSVYTIPPVGVQIIRQERTFCVNVSVMCYLFQHKLYYATLLISHDYFFYMS